ncbi:hypothetical protein [Alkalicoccus chagannorensis]|uniref:hypothetical protein n=1 Tax=Alkalicoccus chagannorensis TaxID=427072 RepID=UPI0012EBC6AA|nr:hypothetical protein [Alkalicoccus chagannorensis]
MLQFMALVDNPIILFFIIAALISLFQSLGRQKSGSQTEGGQGQQQSSSQDQQRDDRGESGKIDWEDVLFGGGDGKKEEKQSQPQSREVEKSEAEKKMDERYEQLKEKQRKASEKAAKVDTSMIEQGDITKSGSHKLDLGFDRMEKEDVIKGIVWSEVLNKPKSRQSGRRH